jgi:hypothetical protein
MRKLYFSGRPDGLGNRLEEIILLEAFCLKENIENIYYIWNNKYCNRKYPILFSANNILLIECANNQQSVMLPKATDFSQKEFISAANKITPKFNIGFENNIKPIGIHIRGTDRIGKKSLHFMKDEKEFNLFLSKTIEIINSINPDYLFICADEITIKNKFIEYLNSEIKIIHPVCSDSVPQEYIDLFALSLCSKIYMVSKFSTFSIIASLINNIPIVSYTYDEEIKMRYKANFEYNIGFKDTKYIKIVTNISPIVRYLRKIKLKIKTCLS